jgi:hypothetical protein
MTGPFFDALQHGLEGDQCKVVKDSRVSNRLN